VRYSGSPLALSFSEWRDAKEVRVLTFENDALTHSRSLPVPCTRALLRLTTTAQDMEFDLAALKCPEGVPRAWLEVTVTASAEPASVLTERIQGALAGRPIEAIALRRSTADDGTGAASPASLHELQPADVFEAVLQDAAIPEAEREPLRLVFTQLMEKHHEQEAVES
jgi:exonuclease SbcD